MERLEQTFRSYPPSSRCWLDGDFIWTVLREHPGTLKESIFLTIGREEGHVKGPRLDDKRPRSDLLLIRVRIDITNADGLNFKHSNLLALDLARGEALRFEPVEEHEFSPEINELLEHYVENSGLNLHYRELPQHPQPNVDGECPHQGMCVAYVVKAGVDLVLGREVEIVSARDIKKFASAVESLYG